MNIYCETPLQELAGALAESLSHGIVKSHCDASGVCETQKIKVNPFFTFLLTESNSEHLSASLTIQSGDQSD